jgi:hypothetical protein
VKALAILLALVAVAHAADPVRKKTPTDKFAKAAAEAFTEALSYDEKGDLRTALGLYEKAQGIAPHPYTAYNIGDVYRRMGKIDDAILMFETYLAMWPDAPDRKECEAIIDKLVHTPGTLYLKTSEKSDSEALAFKDFYIFVDGDLVAKLGTEPKPQAEIHGHLAIALPVQAGSHAIDAVSSISYAHAECKVVAGGKEECLMRAKPRVDGHAVFRSSDNRVGIHKDKSHGFYADRVEVVAGRHQLMVRDRSFECPSVNVEVPGGPNDVAYVYIGTHEWDGFERCRKLTIKQQKLHFDP